MKKTLTTILISVMSLAISPEMAFSQDNSCPLIGAQIFIEPGQDDATIDSFFQRMEETGMQVGRLRLFGSHVVKADGSYDFSLYDRAFDAAARHNVRLFVTLFPPTDELTDVGGFKFPSSQAQYNQVMAYTEASVKHFKSHPALYCWVLQNEPGCGLVPTPAGSLAAKDFEEYCKQHPLERNGYLKADLRKEQFTREYTTRYLKSISDVVSQYDPQHGRHINPHQVLSTLPEYDFASYDFLSSLGCSQHLSWHFGNFERNEFAGGIALMSDIIYNAAFGKPAWVTEMQGGPVTASGNKVLSPRPEEMRQNIWTALFSGMKGVIFWTLNARKAVQEAGEWALLEFTGEPSERMRATAEVIREVNDNKDFFEGASPLKSKLAILYNKESFWIQKRNASISNDPDNPGRRSEAVAQSMASCYAALSSMGLSPLVADIDPVSLSDIEVVMIPDMVSLTERQISKLREFVRKGGTLYLSGMSGYYDADMACRFLDASALDELTGARMREFGISDQYYTLNSCGLRNHIWSGKLKPISAKVLYQEGSDCIASINDFGEGKVIWFPSMIELGAWHNDAGKNESAKQLSAFYSKILDGKLKENEPGFDGSYNGVMMRTLQSGKERMTMIVNKNDEELHLKLKGLPEDFRQVSGTFRLDKDKNLVLDADSHLVIRYSSDGK